MQGSTTTRITEAEKYVYTRSAAQRITNREIEKLEIWRYCCLVKPRNQRPTFISKKSFKEDFAQSRKKRASEIGVTHQKINTKLFTVNSSRDIFHNYSVIAKEDHLYCDCPDQDRQRELNITPAMCKHGYAVLMTLGCNSLKEYIQKNIYKQI